MTKHAFSRRRQQNLRWISVSICMAFFFVVVMSGQMPIPGVFASPQSTPVPSAPLRGIHLGNHYYGEDWEDTLLQRIDGDEPGGIWPSTVVVLSQHVYNVVRSGASCEIQSVEPRNSNIIEYLQQASIHDVRIIIRISPSPGHFDSNHHLQVSTASGCDADHLRSYDDIGEEIIKIHEWNSDPAHEINEFGFEPASEPNIEWYRNEPDPTPIRLDDPRAWSDMDAYFTAIYDYVHTQSSDPTIRVFTPPMSQGAFAEIRDVSSCAERTLSDNSSHGYEKMPNVYLNGTKNDGYNWHNYWKVGYEAWASCEEAATPRGHHVSYWFPPAMWASMVLKPRNITEADLASPPSVHNGQFGDLPDKDALFGVTASDSLDQFINAEQWAERIAVWTLNVTDPTIETGAEQNWHEAYRCNDIGQDGFILSERPWFMRWWSGIPAGFSFTPCYRVFLPMGLKDYTTELIKNGTFDAGGTYWTTMTSHPSCTNLPIFGAIDGNHAAVLARCTYNTDTLSQTITIPDDVSSAQLTFKFRVEQNYSQPIYNDRLYVRIRDRTTGELVPLSSYDDSPPRSVWRSGVSADLTARRGHTLDVIVSATNDNDLRATKFWIDDVSVRITH